VPNESFSQQKSIVKW